MILYCLPYAGGSETIYYSWKKYLHKSIQLEPISLKGRGKRFNEETYQTLEEAVDDIVKQIRNKILTENYALFGHSMGSLLCYELYYKLIELKLRLPEHIFFSAYKPPSIKRSSKKSLLPDDKFLDYLKSMGGISDEAIKNEELISLFLPIIKNDYRMLDGFQYKERSNKIKCQATIMNGESDSISNSDINGWSRHIEHDYRVFQFKGDHFYINQHAMNITQIISDTLV